MSRRPFLILTRTFLTIRFRFFLLIAFLGGVTLANLYWFRSDFGALAGRVTGQQASYAERWQAWAAHYDRLFGMLQEGARIGIQEEGARGSGLVLERRSGAMQVRTTLRLDSEGAGVVLILQRGLAEKLLASVPDGDPEAIWQWMKDLLNERRITIWSDPDLERLHAGGYLAFMRAIDTRPPDHAWPEIRRMLGEIQ